VPTSSESPPDGVGSSDFVVAAARVLAVIRAFGADRPHLTLSEVAEVTGLSRGTARRFLMTLEHLGYVANDGRRFTLRPKTLELGYAYISSISLWDVARMHATETVRRIEESSSVCVLDGDDALYVIRVPANRRYSMNVHAGARLPAYATSTGRVLLAGLPDDALEEYLSRVTLERFTRNTVRDVDELRPIVRAVRTRGWSLLDEELEIGVRSIAVPLPDARGGWTAAINVSTHSSRYDRRSLEAKILPELQGLADAILADWRMHPQSQS
jgi:IclR family pca regulon transcriptional regulator